MKTRKAQPRDLNRLALSIVREATEGNRDSTASKSPDDMSEEERAKFEAAHNGRRGGLKGGSARAAKLSSKRRREIAKKAAEARWHGKG